MDGEPEAERNQRYGAKGVSNHLNLGLVSLSWGCLHHILLPFLLLATREGR